MPQDYSIAQATDVNENWPVMLDEYGVQFLVLHRHDDSDLLSLFRAQPGWAVDFEDGEAVIFARAGVPQSTN